MDDFQSQFTALVIEFAPAENSAVDGDQLSAFFTKTVDELGMDSLDTMELVMKIEDHFEIILDEDLVLSAKTVGDLATLVQKQTKAA